MERSLSELTHATHLKLRQSGKRDAAGMLKQLTESPKRATKIKKSFQQTRQQTPEYSPEEALALITAAKLSCRKYQIMRKSALQKGLKIYPSYERIKDAKQNCYPSKDDCIFTESLGEVKLQSIVDLTIKRLCIVQKEVLKSIGNEALKNLTIIFKWGVDGSGGQCRYKQKWNEDELDDGNMLTTSMVPLQLYGFYGDKKTIIWQNPRPSSTSYCRPIRFRFTKETDNSILEEFANIRNQIESLVATLVDLGSQVLQISQRFEETMVDGKVCNVLASNKATQKCYICNATSKEMNNLELIRQRKSNAATFAWGLSTLHAQIRLMECILHIACRLDVKKWQCRKPEEKQSVTNRKKCIIDKFRSETGLLLDTPKQGGGNTINGNSDRRFFKDAAVASSITGVDQNLIERFYIILRTLSCGYEINIPAFKDYCDETPNLFVALYSWYPMPVTLHKILMHGPEVIEHFLLPIGQCLNRRKNLDTKNLRNFDWNTPERYQGSKQMKISYIIF
jgi:hypothetical protein